METLMETSRIGPQPQNPTLEAQGPNPSETLDPKP